MAKPNRWHPVMLPDDYLRKLKQDLSEVEAQVESKTRYEPDPDFSPPPDDPPPRYALYVHRRHDKERMPSA
jgi:hypothetical protein